MAIACFLLLTRLPPFPLFKLPFFNLCIAFPTVFLAPVPYRGIGFAPFIDDYPAECFVAHFPFGALKTIVTLLSRIEEADMALFVSPYVDYLSKG